MLKNPLLLAMGITLLALLIGFLIPGQPKEQAINLPWQIQVIDNNHSKIFGLTLNQSTLAQAQQQFNAQAEVSLFSDANGMKGVEAYFDEVTLSGLKAKFLLTMALSEAQLTPLYNHGARIASMGSGRHKITLAWQDIDLINKTPIASITYLPKTHLDAPLIVARFGQPAQKIKENSELPDEHWLYPDKGLDIILSEKHKEVLQYVSHDDFAKLIAPLKP
jgi:hypothetical protein